MSQHTPGDVVAEAMLTQETITRLYTDQDMWKAFYTGYTKGFARVISLKSQADVNRLYKYFTEWLDQQEARVIEEEPRC